MPGWRVGHGVTWVGLAAVSRLHGAEREGPRPAGDWSGPSMGGWELSVVLGRNLDGVLVHGLGRDG